MKLNLYSVHDIVAKIFTQPLPMTNDEVVTRVMRNCVNNKEHNYSYNPSDYTLYHIGVYDDEKGKITGKPVKMFTLDKLVDKNKPEFKAVK